MCDGLFLPMKNAQRQRKRKIDRWGEESGVERRMGRGGKQSKERKEKCKAREDGWGKNDNNVKERGKRGTDRKELLPVSR